MIKATLMLCIYLQIISISLTIPISPTPLHINKNYGIKNSTLKSKEIFISKESIKNENKSIQPNVIDTGTLTTKKPVTISALRSPNTQYNANVVKGADDFKSLSGLNSNAQNVSKIKLEKLLTDPTEEGLINKNISLSSPNKVTSKPLVSLADGKVVAGVTTVLNSESSRVPLNKPLLEDSKDEEGEKNVKVEQTENTSKAEENKNTSKVEENENTSKAEENENTSKIGQSENAARVEQSENASNVQPSESTSKVEQNENILKENLLPTAKQKSTINESKPTSLTTASTISEINEKVSVNEENIEKNDGFGRPLDYSQQYEDGEKLNQNIGKYDYNSNSQNYDDHFENGHINEYNNFNRDAPNIHTQIFPNKNGELYDDANSHFFAYFLTMMVMAVLFYLLFHNKQKIIALMIEGRGGRPSRRGSRAKYHKLDNNLEETMSSTRGGTRGVDGIY